MNNSPVSRQPRKKKDRRAKLKHAALAAGVGTAGTIAALKLGPILGGMLGHAVARAPSWGYRGGNDAGWNAVKRAAEAINPNLKKMPIIGPDSKHPMTGMFYGPGGAMEKRGAAGAYLNPAFSRLADWANTKSGGVPTPDKGKYGWLFSGSRDPSPTVMAHEYGHAIDHNLGGKFRRGLKDASAAVSGLGSRTPFLAPVGIGGEIAIQNSSMSDKNKRRARLAMLGVGVGVGGLGVRAEAMAWRHGAKVLKGAKAPKSQMREYHNANFYNLVGQGVPQLAVPTAALGSAGLATEALERRKRNNARR